ncbi:hypothetical protein BM1_00003 [Bipolaris maydis]|nr:hypothetical protein BM1_00003 [Bipolaris maydis]
MTDPSTSVKRTKVKYGICDEEVYNFDEAGFSMGKITTQLVVTASERRGRPKAVRLVSDNSWTNNELGVAWLKHFDPHTKARVIGARRLLILDGHESHQSLQFQEFCKENNTYTLCMPHYSSHLLGPLSVGCLSPLKRVYRREVESLIRNHINHVTKLEFLPAFKAAFDRSFTLANICSAFRSTGLIPLQPDAVLLKLDIKLRTPTPLAVLEAL